MAISLLERLKMDDGIPSAPGVAARVLRFSDEDDPNAADFAQVVSLDPALAATVLRVANSAMYGQRRDVSDIRRAIVVMGLQNAVFMAASIAVVSGFRVGSHLPFDYSAFWTEALARAIVGRGLASRLLPPSRDAAFLACLLSKLGQLILVHCAPDEYEPVLEQASTGEALRDVELEHLGHTHAEIGAAVLEEWGLPAALCAAIRAHDPGDCPTGEGDRLARIAELANCIVVLAKEPGSGDEAAEAGAWAVLAQTCEFEPSTLRSILQDTAKDLPELAAMLGVDGASAEIALTLQKASDHLSD